MPLGPGRGLASAPGIFVAQYKINATSASGSVGYSSVLGIGTLTPSHFMPIDHFAGGAAFGAGIQDWYNATTPGAVSYDIQISLFYDARINQTNQFDTLQVADSSNVLRTYTSVGATYFNAGAGAFVQWAWGNGSSPVMVFGGPYEFVFRKFS